MNRVKASALFKLTGNVDLQSQRNKAQSKSKAKNSSLRPAKSSAARNDLNKEKSLQSHTSDTAELLSSGSSPFSSENPSLPAEPSLFQNRVSNVAKNHNNNKKKEDEAGNESEPNSESESDSNIDSDIEDASVSSLSEDSDSGIESDENDGEDEYICKSSEKDVRFISFRPQKSKKPPIAFNEKGPFYLSRRLS